MNGIHIDDLNSDHSNINEYTQNLDSHHAAQDYDRWE